MELAQSTPDSNTRTLTERLRTLEQLGIVSRHESEALDAAWRRL